VYIPDDLARHLRFLADARSKSVEEVALEELEASARIPGSPQAALQAMLSIQPIPASLVDEMEAAIEEGRIPPSDPAIFDGPSE